MLIYIYVFRVQADRVELHRICYSVTTYDLRLLTIDIMTCIIYGMPTELYLETLQICLENGRRTKVVTLR